MLLSATVATIALLLVALLLSKRSLRAARSELAAAEERWRLALDGAGHGVRDWNAESNRIIGTHTDVTHWRQTEMRLRFAGQVVENVACGIIATDMDGLITDFNPAAERLLGWSAEQVIGRCTPLLFYLSDELRALAVQLSAELAQDVAPAFEVLTAAVLRFGEDAREWTWRRRNSSTVRVLQSVTLLRDAHGEPMGFLFNAVDISVQRRALDALREERNRAQCYLDTVNALILSLDRQGRVTMLNRFGRELLGYSEAQLLGRDWFKTCLAQPEGTAVVRPVFEQLMRGETEASAYFENQVRCANGELRLMAWHNNYLRNQAGEITGTIGAANDITDHRAMEEAKAQAVAEAQRLADLKNAFLANMSHEIRTPLSALLGVAQIGARDYAGRPVAELFGHINDAGRHLLAVINDILDLSRIEAGKLSLESVSFRLSKRVDQAVSLVLPQARQKGLELTAAIGPDLPEWVLGDGLRLEQILINLLGNAVKFTERGSVTLTLEADGEAVLFRVEDTGIGMTDDQLARIFVPFEQADAGVARRFGGSGLGLSICLSLTRLMGGDIRVESRVGVGSRFTLRLPLPSAMPPAVTDPVTESDGLSAGVGQRLTGLRILAVDDIELNRLVLSDLLAHEGAEVVLVADGRQAVASVEGAARPFDLVLMDVQMPGMDGYEAARRIVELCPRLPVIALTAHAMAEERDRCLAAGMAAHLSKPLDIDALVRQVAALLPRRRSLLPDHLPVPVQETRSPLPPEAPSGGCVDWDALHERFSSIPGFVDRLVRTALRGERDGPAQLRALAGSRSGSMSSGSTASVAPTPDELDALFRKAHAIKGLAANLRANALTALAAEVCALARAGDAAAFDQVEPLAAALDAVIAELSRHIECADPGADDAGKAS